MSDVGGVGALGYCECDCSMVVSGVECVVSVAGGLVVVMASIGSVAL